MNQIGDNSIRTILEELFRGKYLIINHLFCFELQILDTLVTSLANHLTSENDMSCRYKRKKVNIEQAFNQAVVELQEKKLPKDRKI